jgi:PTS system ascorbate-specific IIB component
MAKLDNKKIMVCGGDASVYLMMKMTLQKVLKKFKIAPAQVLGCVPAQGTPVAADYDLVFCPADLAADFEAAQKKGTVVLGIRSILSDREMERAMWEAELLN